MKSSQLLIEISKHSQISRYFVGLSTSDKIVPLEEGNFTIVNTE